MKQFLRFIFIVAVISWLPWVFLGIGIGAAGNTISDNILKIIVFLSIAMVLFLIARWLNKRDAFDIKKDGLYVLKNMGICCLIYLSMGLIVWLSYAFKKFFSF